MRATLALFIAALTTLSGCIGSADEDLDAASTSDADAVAGTPDASEPVVQVFEGRILSEGGRLAHFSATEETVAPFWREGTVMTVRAIPLSLRGDLTWTSATPTARLMTMIDTPNGEKLRTYFTEPSDSGAVCFVIPVEEIQNAIGEWAIMVHVEPGSGAVNVGYQLAFTTIGGDVELQTDRYHMEVEREELPLADDGREPAEPAPCPTE